MNRQWNWTLQPTLHKFCKGFLKILAKATPDCIKDFLKHFQVFIKVLMKQSFFSFDRVQMDFMRISPCQFRHFLRCHIYNTNELHILKGMLNCTQTC